MNRSLSVAAVLVAWAGGVTCGSGPTQAPQAPVGSAAPAPSTPAAPPAAAPTSSVGAAPAPTQPATPAEQQHWQTVQSLAAGISAHDVSRIAAAYAPDAELTVIPAAGVLHGRDAIAADQKPFFQAFPDYHFGVSRAWVTGDVVIAEQVGFGTNTGDFLGLKATGKRAGQTSLAIFWFSTEGLISREHLYEDGAALLAQLAGQQGAPPVPTLPEKTDVLFAGPDQHANEALAVGRAYIEAASHKDVPKMLSLLADEAEFDMPMAPPEKGKDQIRQSYEHFASAFPDARWDVSNAWGVGTYAIFEYAVQGTQDGPIGPIPATHRKVDWHWARVFEVRGGKIVHGWAYANTIELMGELGVLAPKQGEPRSPSKPAKPAKPGKAAPPANH